jgi:tRNA (guanine-N7-)-methyltransferase
MNKEQHAAFLAAAERAEWVPASLLERADLGAIFGDDAPVEVDLGCGDGGFITGMAQRFPERNFLGTERLLGRVEKVARGAARLGLKNLRVVRLESSYVVKYLLPQGSVETAYVLFPDPWPKRHHHPRRLFQPPFVDDVRHLLKVGGLLRVKTDDLPYFQWMEKVIADAHGWERVDWPQSADEVMTDFERRFVAQGLPINRVCLRRVE